MNRNLLFLLLFAVSPFFVLAQVDETKPFEVAKNVGYAKSAPLSEIAARLSPDKIDAIPVEKENKNKLDFDKWPDSDPTRVTENVQTTMGQRISRGPGVGFNGQGPTGSYPPDTDGDVSDEHFIQVVNSKYNVYTKDGTKVLGPLNLSTLWQSLPGPWQGANHGDPIVLWDEGAERWMITQFYVPNSGNNYELFAISESSDPLGAYHLYAFSFGTTMNDYPKIGVWRDGYYATYNMFQNGGHTGSRITCVDRDKMLIGDPDAEMISFHKNGYYSTMPADIDGEALPLETDACPVMYITSAKTIQLWGLAADWETPANSSLNLMKTLIPTNFSKFNGNITQPNGQSLDALQNMIMNRLAYRKFDTYASMVVNHTVYASGKAGIRWYEMRKEDGDEWALYQEGTYAPDTDVHRWMGSAAMNGRGDISIAYSVANNDDVHPSIRYTGRLAADPLGEMTIQEVELKTGTTSQSGFSRWGDYSCLNVDPADDTTFWFTTEYNGWRTWISSYDLGGISGPSVNAGEDGYICTNDQFTTSASGSGILSMEWTTDGDGFFSPANGFEVTYIRGNQDVANGGCTLTLTATGFDGVTTSSDDMELYIVPTANAGEDATIFNTESFSCEGSGTTIGTIEWTTSGDGEFSDAGIMTPIYTPGETDLANGYATLTLTTAVTEPCVADKDDSMLLTIQTVGVNDLEASNKLSIYPNPTNDIFTLNIDGLTSGEEFTYMVYTSYGKEVYRQIATAKADTYERVIDMSDFVAGIYFVSVQTENGNTTMKVVKK